MLFIRGQGSFTVWAVVVFGCLLKVYIQWFLQQVIRSGHVCGILWQDILEELQKVVCALFGQIVTEYESIKHDDTFFCRYPCTYTKNKYCKPVKVFVKGYISFTFKNFLIVFIQDFSWYRRLFIVPTLSIILIMYLRSLRLKVWHFVVRLG